MYHLHESNTYFKVVERFCYKNPVGNILCSLQASYSNKKLRYYKDLTHETKESHYGGVTLFVLTYFQR